jgi:hypothetical protein
MKWTKEEEQFLIDNYAEYGAIYCAEKLNKNARAIYNKAFTLKLKANKLWTKKEEQFLIDNYEEEGAAYCVKALNRTLSSVIQKANGLKLSKKLTFWTPEEEKFLIDNYPEKGGDYCAEKLSKTYRSVCKKAERLNVRSSFTPTYSNSNIVYTVYFPDFFLYKVGVTNCIERRAKEFGRPCVILKTAEYDTAEEAAEVERKLLKSVQLVNTGELRNGNTETFTQLSREIEEFLA